MSEVLFNANKIIDSLVAKKHGISQDRRNELDIIANSIHTSLKNDGNANIIFICTHNSRRSQLCELWMDIFCDAYNLKYIRNYSGGTEATAFNKRMVKAIQDFNIPLHKLMESENTIYAIQDTNHSMYKTYFSKKYENTYNPNSNFIAIMVCDDAEENCPIVFGSSKKHSLKYKDPKFSDETPEEELVYAQKVIEVGTELLYLVGLLRK